MINIISCVLNLPRDIIKLISEYNYEFDGHPHNIVKIKINKPITMENGNIAGITDNKQVYIFNFKERDYIG